MEFCFINGLYDFVYVWSYSDSSLSIWYKILAIGAEAPGGILSWVVLNSIVLFFFRIKNKNKEDLVFIRSIILSNIASLLLVVVLIYHGPFMTFSNLNPVILSNIYNDTPATIILTRQIFPFGFGMPNSLKSILLLIHPLTTFFSYAILLVPFSITVAEILTPRRNLLHPYQQKFLDFSLKCGWFLSTLAIGLGAYWASVSTSWNLQYWVWDPVETSLLIPWIFNTAYFHTKGFQILKRKSVVRLNIILIFLSIILATLITRGGGFTSLHTGLVNNEILLLTIIIGIILLSISLYVIYIFVGFFSEEYKKRKFFFDYLTYVFFFFLAFICIIGLLVPPLTLYLSQFIPLTVVNIVPSYYIYAASIPATFIGVSLIFCSLWGDYKLVRIGEFIIVVVLTQLTISLILLNLFNLWINPTIAIYSLAIFSSIFKICKSYSRKMSFKQFYSKISRFLLHLGISFILVGSLGGTKIFQDVFYITGFYILVLGIIPSMVTTFLKQK
jgi:cytochrome c biogenesis factor